MHTTKKEKRSTLVAFMHAHAWMKRERDVKYVYINFVNKTRIRKKPKEKKEGSEEGDELVDLNEDGDAGGEVIY